MFVMAMVIEDLVVTNIDKWKQMVVDAGGQWVGVQLPFLTTDPSEQGQPLCLFTGPNSANPQALRPFEMIPANVAKKLNISKTKPSLEQEFRAILDIVQEARDTANKLNHLADIIEEEINAKK